MAQSGLTRRTVHTSAYDPKRTIGRGCQARPACRARVYASTDKPVGADRQKIAVLIGYHNHETGVTALAVRRDSNFDV
jgi:hypothetical protein